MGEIDRLAKTSGNIKPQLWWRYRDDIIDVWKQGLPKLLEFTDFINSLYPTIKFELVYSETELNVLGLTLRLENGFISTDVYAKPTDIVIYICHIQVSAHPIQCKNTQIPYGVALRIKRNCSDNSDLSKRCEEYKRYLVRQEYPNH